MTKSERKKQKSKGHCRFYRTNTGPTTQQQPFTKVNGISSTQSTKPEADPTSISRFRNDFINLGPIGEGRFGTVYKAKHRLDGQIYAVKRTRIRAKDSKKIFGEVKWLTKLVHESVVRYYNSWMEYSSENDTHDTSDEQSESDEDQSATVGSSIVFADNSGDDDSQSNKITAIGSPSTESRFLYIQMEYGGIDTLRTYIDKGLCKLQKRRLKIFRKILDGLEYIHHQDIIHRDLKPENIFIDHGAESVKIGDFGLATGTNKKKYGRSFGKANSFNGTDKLTANIGSLMYVSPEVLSEERRATYGKEVDIYSLGIILFEMCYKPLTTGMERAKVLGDVRSKEILFPDDFYEIEMSRETPLIRCMLNHDPKQRRSAKGLKQLLRTSSCMAQHRLGKWDILCALMNSILNPSCSKESKAMPLMDIESAFLKHCQGVSTPTISSFKKACGITLRQFFERKPELYELYRSRENGEEMARLKVDQHLPSAYSVCLMYQEIYFRRH